MSDKKAFQPQEPTPEHKQEWDKWDQEWPDTLVVNWRTDKPQPSPIVFKRVPGLSAPVYSAHFDLHPGNGRNNGAKHSIISGQEDTTAKED